MKYEIQSDDILDKKKHRRKIYNNSKPFLIHLAIIIIIIIALILFLNNDFKFSSSKNSDESLRLEGIIEKFEKEHRGNFTLYAKKYTISTDVGSFDGTDKELILEDFNGIIYYNKTNQIIEFKGTAKNLIFDDKNKIIINGNSFIMNTSEKVSFETEFENLNLSFSSGDGKYSNKFSFDLDNTSVILSKIKMNLEYNKKFLFNIISEDFKIINHNLGIIISKKND